MSDDSLLRRAMQMLTRCLPIIQSDAAMMDDLTRHAPLPPDVQAQHDATEYESEKLVMEMPTLIEELHQAVIEEEAWDTMAEEEAPDDVALAVAAAADEDAITRLHEAVLTVVEDLAQGDPPADSELGKILARLGDALDAYERVVFAALAQPGDAAVPAWCEVHQHRKWCEHNGGVMGASGWEAPAAVRVPHTPEAQDGPP